MDLAPGATVAGRYRVQERAWTTGKGAVWLAHDAVLERPVLIQTFPGASAHAIGTAVTRTAQLSHPGLCQIYDVSTDPPGIVFEHAPGGRLADRKEGALAPADAARMVCQLSAAINALHEHGVAHGAISPSTVLFDEEGRPKLAGALLTDGLGEEGADAYRPSGEADPDERDRYALAAVAYRLFTGREPGPDAPPARSAKRGVPSTVDALLSRALARDAAHRPSLAEFRRVLDPIASAEQRERGPGFFRQEMKWLVPVLLVIAFGIAAIVIGVTKVTSNNEAAPNSSPTASPVAFKVLSVHDFDPPPGNGQEHPDEAADVIDGEDTAWSTVGYSRVALDGRKKGVGLLFDLEPGRSVGRIEVRTPKRGWKAEWRVSDVLGTKADDFEVVATFDANGQSVTINPARSARYWLLWITSLVDSGSGGPNPYQAQVSEVQFFAR